MTMETTQKNSAIDVSGVLICFIIFTIVLFRDPFINLICHGDLSDKERFVKSEL